MNFDFQNKIVLVTGASRGIGKAIAGEFAKAGATIALHYHVNHDAADKTLALLPGKGHYAVAADISNGEQVIRLAGHVIERSGRIDVLVNNAGVFEEFRIMDLSFDDWRKAWHKTLDTNLTGTAHLTFLVAKQMMRQGGGKIVNVSSRGAFRGEPDAPAYGASKAGLNALGQSFAKALAPHNIYVYTVAPGYVDTEMAATAMEGDRGEEIRKQSPLKRIASPAEIARTVCFLASEGTDYLTGCIVDINGASYLRT